MHDVEAKGILSAKNGMNIYRGCTHGCIYCDSRSLCYHMDHDFEDVEIKRNAPELLEAALRAKGKKGMIGTGSMSDPYMPLERKEGLTRACAQIVERYGFGFTVITKSTDVLRDLDILEAINRRAKCVVQMTLTTCDEALCRLVEPGAPTTDERVEALNILRERGIPTVVWISPILPFINDSVDNLRGLMKRCVEAGVRGVVYFGAGMTLRDGNREYYYQQLDRHFPGLSDRYRRTYQNAYVVASGDAARLDGIVRDACARHDILLDTDRVFAYLSSFEEKYKQISLFDG